MKREESLETVGLLECVAGEHPLKLFADRRVLRRRRSSGWRVCSTATRRILIARPASAPYSLR